MNENPETRASFFKVIIRDDFTRLLRLPPMFMKKYGSKLHEQVKLRIESGRTWDVKVEAIEDGMFCFSSFGWNNFAKHVELKYGYFLVFMLNDGGFLLDVSIYDTSYCKKEFPTVVRNPSFRKESPVSKVARNPNFRKGESSARNFNFRKGESSAVPTIARNPNFRKGESSALATVARNPNFIKEKSPEVSTIARNPNLEKMSNPFYYEIVLNSHHQSRLTPKRPFVRAVGLMEKQKVKFVGEHGSQLVSLDRNFRDAMRVDLTHGWAEFRTANNLVYGKTYSLEFKPDQNVIIVKEVQD